LENPFSFDGGLKDVEIKVGQTFLSALRAQTGMSATPWSGYLVCPHVFTEAALFTPYGKASVQTY
jgi:hypothetical protein